MYNNSDYSRPRKNFPSKITFPSREKEDFFLKTLRRERALMDIRNVLRDYGLNTTITENLIAYIDDYIVRNEN